MTVAELIEALVAIRDKHGGDLDIATEGCDCDGSVHSVSVIEYPDEEPYVYLER